MSASPLQFPAAGGVLAPVPSTEAVDQLEQERQEERINAPRLEKFLNKTLDAIASLDQHENLKIHNAMIRCVAYYDDRWDGKAENGEWIDNPVIEGEIVPKDNEYKKQVDKLLMEMSRGRIQQDCEAVSKFNQAKREAAQFAARRITVNQERIETENFIQAENFSLVVKGTAFRYTFFDLNAESMEQSVELKVLRSMGEAASITVCRTCGMSVDPKRLEAAEKATTEIVKDDERRAEFKANEALGTNCPHCGDTETRTIAAPATEKVDYSQQKKPAGRVATIRPDATMVQLDLNARDIQSSSFIRWRLVMRRCDWEAMYPNVRIPSSEESEESRHRSEAQNQPSNSGWTSTVETTGGDQFEKIEGELVWLDKKVYQRYRSNEVEKLRGGQVLEADQPLESLCPQGACVVRIKNTILDILPSNKNKCWTMCVYGLREHALHGAGTMALLGPQDTINEANALILANQIQNAAGRDVVRSGAIEGGQLPRLDQVAYISDAPQEVGDIARWAMGKIQPSPLSGEVYAFRQDMKASLQDAAGTSSLSMQGAADAKVLGTATGVEASRDQAVGRMIPNRKLQAFAGSEWARQVLELERDNYTPEVFSELAGKGDEKGEVEFTERGLRTFFEMDVSTELSIKPAEGSWVPTTPAQEKANANEFGQLAARIQDPAMLSLLAPKYGIDYSVDEWGAAQRSAAMRLEEYARVSDIISKGGYPPSLEMVGVVLQNCAEWAQVDPLMDKHDAYRNFYKDWFVSDEGRNADPLLRMVVREVYKLQGSGTAKQAQEVAAIKIEAEEPQQELQQEDAMAAQEAAALAAEQAKAEGKSETVMRAIGEQMLSERDREHAAQVEMEKAEHGEMVDAMLPPNPPSQPQE